MRWILHIIRVILTLILIYFAYKETGLWTGINLLGLWVAVEGPLIIAEIKGRK